MQCMCRRSKQPIFLKMAEKDMEKKSIAFVMDTMAVGGVEKALIELLKAFDYSRYNVTLWLKNDSGPLHNQIDTRVKIEYWECKNTRDTLLKQLKQGKLISFFRGAFYRIFSRIHLSEYDLNAFYSVKSLPQCSDHCYDCVIAYQVLSPAVVANALYRFRGLKKVLWVHGRNVRPQSLNVFFDKEYCKFDLIACVSESTRTEFSHDFPKAKKKTAVFYNLLSSHKIKEQCEEQLNTELRNISIVTVGRLVSIKGQAMIPLTTRLLLDAGYDVYWYLVGDGDLRETVESEIQKYDVAEHVILLGTQMNPYPYIKNCDIYVQTSFSEGYCTTTMEAKILRKPIVTTDAPGMREQFVSGENGLIVDAMTPEALFEGIRTLLDHPELQAKFVENLSHEVCDNSGELQKLYDFIES